MIRLYHGSGSGEIQLIGEAMGEKEWNELRQLTARLLRARKAVKAADLLEFIPFKVYDGTNFFGDEFCLLYYKAPLEKYVELAEIENDSTSRTLFKNIADTMCEIGPYIRFIAVDLDAKAGPEAVVSPTLQITSDAVERTLADAEQLIVARGASSGVDRVHTVFHAYLIALCTKLGISVVGDLGITQLFKILRNQSNVFPENRTGSAEIDRVVNSMATIIDALNPIRNRSSAAHPNVVVLEEPEAMLFINAVRTLLHYLDARYRHGNE